MMRSLFVRWTLVRASLSAWFRRFLRSMRSNLLLRRVLVQSQCVLPTISEKSHSTSRRWRVIGIGCMTLIILGIIICTQPISTNIPTVGTSTLYEWMYSHQPSRMDFFHQPTEYDRKRRCQKMDGEMFDRWKKRMERINMEAARVQFVPPPSTLPLASQDSILGTPTKRQLQPGVEIYVTAPSQHTGWLGQSDVSEGDGSKGNPYRSLLQAKSHIRSLKQSKDGLPVGGVRVLLRGSFQLRESLEFGPDDSGTEYSPIIWKSRTGEQARIHGGIDIPKRLIRHVTDPTIRQRVGETIADRIRWVDLDELGLKVEDLGFIRSFGFAESVLPTQSELFLNGETFHLARWPNEGWERVGNVVREGSVPRRGVKLPEDQPQGFEFTMSESIKERTQRWKRPDGTDLTKPDDIHMYGLWQYDWSEQSVKVEAIDLEKVTISSVQSSHYGVRADAKFYFYNILEELNRPYEYYLCKKEMRVYFMPPQEFFDAADAASSSVGMLSASIQPASDSSSSRRLLRGGIDDLNTPPPSDEEDVSTRKKSYLPPSHKKGSKPRKWWGSKHNAVPSATIGVPAAASSPPPYVPFLSLSLLSTPLVVLDEAHHITMDRLTLEQSRGSGVRILRSKGNISIRGCTIRNVGNVGLICGFGAGYGGKLQTWSDSHDGAKTLLDHAGDPDIVLPNPSPITAQEEYNTVYGYIGASLFSRNFIDTTWHRECGIGVSIHGNKIYSTGAGGIILGGGNRLTFEQTGNSAIANTIHTFSRTWFTYRPGIWIDGYSVTVARNHIYDAPHSAIIIHGNDHLIELNDISHVCTHTKDTGAIYTGRDWSQRGHTIRWNFVHSITGVKKDVMLGLPKLRGESTSQHTEDPATLLANLVHTNPSNEPEGILRVMKGMNFSASEAAKTDSSLMRTKPDISASTLLAHLTLHSHTHVGQDCNAFYLDDMSSGTAIYGNIVSGVERGVLIGGGRDNTVWHNVFLNTSKSLRVDQRGVKKMAYHASETGILQKRLRAVPLQEKLWREHYPSLFTILDESPSLPLNNSVRHNILLHSGEIDCERAAKNGECKSTNQALLPLPQVQTDGKGIVGGLESLVHTQGSNVILHRAHDSYEGLNSPLPITSAQEWIEIVVPAPSKTPEKTDAELLQLAGGSRSVANLMAAARATRLPPPVRMNHAALKGVQADYLPIPIELVGPCQIGLEE